MLFHHLESSGWLLLLNVIHSGSMLKPGFVCLHAELLLALTCGPKNFFILCVKSVAWSGGEVSVDQTVENNVALVYCLNAHQSDSFLAAIYF